MRSDQTVAGIGVQAMSKDLAVVDLLKQRVQMSKRIQRSQLISTHFEQIVAIV